MTRINDESGYNDTITDDNSEQLVAESGILTIVYESGASRSFEISQLNNSLVSRFKDYLRGKDASEINSTNGYYFHHMAGEYAAVVDFSKVVSIDIVPKNK